MDDELPVIDVLPQPRFVLASLEAGRRRLVGGQEELLADIALDLAAAAAG